MVTSSGDDRRGGPRRRRGPPSRGSPERAAQARLPSFDHSLARHPLAQTRSQPAETLRSRPLARSSARPSLTPSQTLDGGSCPGTAGRPTDLDAASRIQRCHTESPRARYRCCVSVSVCAPSAASDKARAADDAFRPGPRARAANSPPRRLSVSVSCHLFRGERRPTETVSQCRRAESERRSWLRRLE